MYDRQYIGGVSGLSGVAYGIAGKGNGDCAEDLKSQCPVRIYTDGAFSDVWCSLHCDYKERVISRRSLELMLNFSNPRSVTGLSQDTAMVAPRRISFGIKGQEEGICW